MSWNTSALGATGTPCERTSDIVESIRQFFGKDLVRRVALHRRLSCDAVETAIGLALPSLLSALVHLASRPLGAGMLACSVTRQFPATLESIRSCIGCERQDVAATYGWGYIEYLIGADEFAAVCTDMASVSHLDDEEAKMLVGLIGWVLMSQLRVEKQRLDLNASGLADLLRCSCGGDLARSRSAGVGTLLFMHRRDANAKSTRAKGDDARVVSALPGTIGTRSRGTNGATLGPSPRGLRRRETIHTGG